MKKQTTIHVFFRNDLVFFLLLGLLLFLCFILLVPKVASTIFPQKRAELLQKFISETTKNNDIDLPVYAQFREFYSPGSFIYKKSGLSNQNQAIQIFNKLDPQATAQLLFSSQLLTSVGGRTKNTSFIALNKQNGKILVHTSSLEMIENGQTISLLFLKPVAQVKTANGFLQNEPVSDEKYGDMWLEMTTIKE